MVERSAETLTRELEPVVAALGLDLFDLEVGPGLVRVALDRPGGIDLDGLADANKALSAALDRLDPLPGRYTLEVTSPGVERRLRTPVHFDAATGETVTVRLVPGQPEPRRIRGVVAAADADAVVLEGPEVPGGTVRLPYGVIERARTVFEWGAKPAPTPSRGRAGKGRERVQTP